MEIDFSQISVAEKKVVYQEDDWFPVEEFTLESDTVDAEISVRRVPDDSAVLHGKLKCSLGFSCDSCCEKVVFDIDSTFEYVLRNEVDDALEEQEKECSEEDINTLYLEGSVVDLDEILREQLFLAIPDRRLCSQNCKGLCPECGINRNNETCNCGEVNTNSPFAVLKKLKM